MATRKAQATKQTAAPQAAANPPAPAPAAITAAKPTRKIAIVGCSDTKTLAPYDDPSWDIWAMNNSFVHTKRQNAWFEIHPIKFENGKFFRRELIRPGVFRWADNFRGQPMPAYMESLANLNVPVYMQQRWDVIPKSEAYPLQKIVSTFGNYFTNSVSYMIALAILQIVEARNGGIISAGEIGCWGVDMATSTEYGPQRPSCEFFLGVAAGLQISITIPPQADLLKTRFLYGFQEREAQAWEEKMLSMLSAMDQRRNAAEAKRGKMHDQVMQYMGAQEALREVQRIWSNLGDKNIWRGPDGKISS
jgi:hypothetical protein